MTDIMIQKLTGHIPDNILQQLRNIAEIDGPKRCSNFLGQIKTESAFTKFSENLNYSAKRLMEVFPKYFTTEQAKVYANNPEKIGNRVYANRMGNGPEQSGDGYRYRGRGALQVTGKDNYTALGKYLNIDLISDPDKVATEYALASAAWFFTKNNLWTICDKGVDVATITILTRRINGGEHGLQQRIQYTQEFYNILT